MASKLINTFLTLVVLLCASVYLADWFITPPY